MGSLEQIDGDRLTRIEQKLDNLTEAFVSLARVEERTTTLFRDHAATESALAALGARLTIIETAANQNGVTIKQGERLFWIIVAAVSTVISSVAVYYLTQGV